jgi:multiple antibiotic resistance protein
MEMLSVAVSLFLLMDSVGNIPIFLSILKKIPDQRQRYIIFREMVISLIVIIGFYFIGDTVLSFLSISHQAVQITGGVILFLIGLKLIFPTKNGFEWEGGQEPFLVPLAVPLIAGPAVLAGVMLYSRQQMNHWVALGAIFIAWIATTVILLAATQLKRLLGDKGIAACERFTGLLLVMLAFQMFLNGIQTFFFAK